MRTLDAAILAAMAKGTVVARDFVWITAKDRDTGDPVSRGFWTGAPNIITDVVDALTGSSVSRAFLGGGRLISVGTVPLVADISVRSVDIVLSQVASETQAIVRTYDARLAPVQVYRGYFDVDTRALLADPRARFVGFIDEAPVTTPAEGNEGAITLNCVSVTRELTKTSTAVRSHEDQIARYPSDNFRQDVNVVGKWDLAWGRTRETAGG